jgi:hypothetical protein
MKLCKKLFWSCLINEQKCFIRFKSTRRSRELKTKITYITESIVNRGFAVYTRRDTIVKHDVSAMLVIAFIRMTERSTTNKIYSVILINWLLNSTVWTLRCDCIYNFNDKIGNEYLENNNHYDKTKTFRRQLNVDDEIKS